VGNIGRTYRFQSRRSPGTMDHHARCHKPSSFGGGSYQYGSGRAAGKKRVPRPARATETPPRIWLAEQLKSLIRSVRGESPSATLARPSDVERSGSSRIAVVMVVVSGSSLPNMLPPVTRLLEVNSTPRRNHRQQAVCVNARRAVATRSYQQAWASISMSSTRRPVNPKQLARRYVSEGDV